MISPNILGGGVLNRRTICDPICEYRVCAEWTADAYERMTERGVGFNDYYWDYYLHPTKEHPYPRFQGFYSVEVPCAPCR